MRIHPESLRPVVVAALAVAAFGVSLTGQVTRTTGVGQAPGASREAEIPVIPTGLIVGQVVDATSGRPLGDIAVTIGGGTSTTILAAGDIMTTANAPGGRSGAPRQLLTNAQGQFVFHSLTKGLYTIRTNAPGYVIGGPGQHRPNGPVQPIILTADDSKINGVTIRLWRIATLSGTVVDEAGEPIIGLPISAMRRTTVNGQVRFASQSTMSTDDRGMYRLAVTPGDYVVTAQSTQTTLPVSVADAYIQAISSGGNLANNELYRNLSSSGVSLSPTGYRVGDQLFQGGSNQRMGVAPPTVADDTKPHIYPSTTYPSAASMSQGTVITLGSGENRSGVDLQLRLMPTLRVSGTVTGPEGPGRNLGVKLFMPGADAITGLIQNQESASTATDANGAFTFLGVTPGQYTLKIVRVPRPVATPMPSNATTIEVAGPGGMMMMGMSNVGAMPPPPPPIPTEPTLWATMPVVVGDTDVTGLNVALRAGARVSGRVQFEGTKPPPPPEQLLRTNIALTSNEPRSFMIPLPIVRVDAEGRFSSGGFPAGRYQVAGNVPTTIVVPGTTSGWIFKSATLNGKNLADDPLEIDGDDISGVIVTFTDRTSSLGGTVTDATGKPDTAAEVVAFPADSQAWRLGLPNPRRIRIGRVSQTGSYEFGNLPAGDYHVAAIGAASVGDPQDPKFLERVVPQATKVTVGDGDKRVENLTTKVVR